jgi:putative Mn2+ efflux pump MntP
MINIKHKRAIQYHSPLYIASLAFYQLFFAVILGATGAYLLNSYFANYQNWFSCWKLLFIFLWVRVLLFS